MRDVQAEEDRRGKVIHKVGVRNVAARIMCGKTSLWGDFSVYVTLPELARGAHMSRFVEAVQKPQDILTPVRALTHYLNEIENRHPAEGIFLKLRTHVPFLLTSPISKKVGCRKIPVELSANRLKNCMPDYFIRIQIYVTSLCPCSKEISNYGAHNQRAKVDVRAQITCDVNIDILIRDLYMVGSAPIYPILKRPDEKFVTEQAYDNPKFCEDVVRDAASYLESVPNIKNFSVVVESEESIHDHNALAIIDHFKFD